MLGFVSWGAPLVGILPIRVWVSNGHLLPFSFQSWVFTSKINKISFFCHSEKTYVAVKDISFTHLQMPVHLLLINLDVAFVTFGVPLVWRNFEIFRNQTEFVVTISVCNWYTIFTQAGLIELKIY